MEAICALLALTLLEIVLGIDNIVFITILTARLPVAERSQARRWGLALAMLTRILLLLSISWIASLTQPLFRLSSLGLYQDWLTKPEHRQIDEISLRDLILLAGGLFLILKSVQEIHEQMEGETESEAAPRVAGFRKVIFSIAVFDIIFSLDSVITAVGMAKDLWVMIAAIVCSVGVMLWFSNPVGHFVEKHPTIKVLALSFLILIGVMLVAEGAGQEIEKGYIYFAMAFALAVEMLNIRIRPHAPPEALTTPGGETPAKTGP